MNSARICFVLLLVGLLTACVTAPAPQLEHSLVLTSDGCVPDWLRVPTAETITLNINNQTGQPYEWIVMARPVPLPLQPDSTADIWIRLPIPASGKTTLSFTAPAAAGEYDALCYNAANVSYLHPGKLIAMRLTPTTTK